MQPAGASGGQPPRAELLRELERLVAEAAAARAHLEEIIQGLDACRERLLGAEPGSPSESAPVSPSVERNSA